MTELWPKKSGRLIRVNRETFSDAEGYILLQYIFLINTIFHKR